MYAVWTGGLTVPPDIRFRFTNDPVSRQETAMADVSSINSTTAIEKMNALTEESIAVNLASAADQASEGMASAVSQTGAKVYQ